MEFDISCQCRMLQVKEHLTTVLEELDWENLKLAQRKH